MTASGKRGVRGVRILSQEVGGARVSFDVRIPLAHRRVDAQRLHEVANLHDDLHRRPALGARESRTKHVDREPTPVDGHDLHAGDEPSTRGWHPSHDIAHVPLVAQVEPERIDPR